MQRQQQAVTDQSKCVTTRMFDKPVSLYMCSLVGLHGLLQLSLLVGLQVGNMQRKDSMLLRPALPGLMVALVPPSR